MKRIVIVFSIGWFEWLLSPDPQLISGTQTSRSTEQLHEIRRYADKKIEI